MLTGRRTAGGSAVSASASAVRQPENSPTDMNPAWPRLSSPSRPTTRFSDTAMTMYTATGTSIFVT